MSICMRCGQVPARGCRYLAHGSSRLRSVHPTDGLQSPRPSTRKRSRPNGLRVPSGRVAGGNASGDKATLDSSLAQTSRRVLLLVESEGAVFDTLSERHAKAYEPAFVERFAWGVDPVLCAHLWNHLALHSRLRGESPLLVLLYALRLLNRHAPSVRRSAVIRVLESYMASPAPDPLVLAAAGEGSPERLILSWIVDAERLVDALESPRHFEAAGSFLHSVKDSAPNATALIHSSLQEAAALNMWEMAGLGDCFLRIAGSERGDFPGYVQMALANGYDQESVLVVGTTYSAWLAAQRAGTRLYPILPSQEEESWQFFKDVYFPAFLRGEAAFVDRDEREFVRMIFDDLDSGF